MVSLDEKRVLKVRQKQYLPVRILLVVAGLAACILPSWQLSPALSPLSVFSLFFAIIIAGAVSVGLAFIYAGLFGRSVLWTIRPGQIRIVSQHPFGPAEVQTYQPTRDTQLDIYKESGSDGPDTWRILLTTPDGKRLWMNPQRSPDAAEAELQRIDRLFRSRPAA